MATEKLELCPNQVPDGIHAKLDEIRATSERLRDLILELFARIAPIMRDAARAEAESLPQLREQGTCQMLQYLEDIHLVLRCVETDISEAKSRIQL